MLNNNLQFCTPVQHKVTKRQLLLSVPLLVLGSIMYVILSIEYKSSPKNVVSHHVTCSPVLLKVGQCSIVVCLKSFISLTQSNPSVFPFKVLVDCIEQDENIIDTALEEEVFHFVRHAIIAKETFHKEVSALASVDSNKSYWGSYNTIN